jgi:CheY-like chemotaxis protein
MDMQPLIMTIDDTQEILELYEDILTDASYRVSLHAYRPRTLADVTRVRPDVIISDYVPIDEQQSWQFLQHLTTDRETAPIPLIICTTSATLARDKAGWLRAKGVRVVQKPFNVDDLLQAVALQIGLTEPDQATPAGESNGA